MEDIVTINNYQNNPRKLSKRTPSPSLQSCLPAPYVFHCFYFLLLLLFFFFLFPLCPFFPIITVIPCSSQRG